MLLKIQLFIHLLSTSANVTAGHFSRRFPRTRWQRPLSTSSACLLPRGRGLKNMEGWKFFFKPPWAFRQVPSGRLRLHQCFHRCLTRQSSELSGSAAPWRYSTFESWALLFDFLYLVWRPHFKLGEERLRAKFIQVFFPWKDHIYITWIWAWWRLYGLSSSQTDLPKGVISSEPNWTALFFIKRPE